MAWCPTPGELRPADQEILAHVEAGFESGGRAARSRAACAPPCSEAMRLASEVNKYLDTAAPWFEIKTDKHGRGHDDLYRPARHRLAQGAASRPSCPSPASGCTASWAITQPLFGEQYVETRGRQPGRAHCAALPPGARPADAGSPASCRRAGAETARPLFRKLEESIVEEEARLGQPLKAGLITPTAWFYPSHGRSTPARGRLQQLENLAALDHHQDVLALAILPAPADRFHHVADPIQRQADRQRLPLSVGARPHVHRHAPFPAAGGIFSRAFSLVRQLALQVRPPAARGLPGQPAP